MQWMSILFYFLVIVPSAIIHEYAHGLMADRLGDPTARYAGRLTLNPKAHIDLWGTLVMPILLSVLSAGKFLFAYAKPVPYNPYNLKNQKWGPALVALAGPLSNFSLALAFSLLIRFLPVTNLTQYLYVIVYANVLLMVFNLVPIPPLDGSKILYAVLPPGNEKFINLLEKNSFIILLVFVLFLFDLIFPIINFIVNLLVGF
ncbi:MAG TPA: site-2 protease family protein [Candidatus Magasanikbacteria bacterium]|nr:site-2 protease family protein [Candidatus Magasanikbacteria bacterium]